MKKINNLLLIFLLVFASNCVQKNYGMSDEERKGWYEGGLVFFLLMGGLNRPCSMVYKNYDGDLEFNSIVSGSGPGSGREFQTFTYLSRNVTINDTIILKNTSGVKTDTNRIFQWFTYCDLLDQFQYNPQMECNSSDILQAGETRTCVIKFYHPKLNLKVNTYGSDYNYSLEIKR